MTNKLLVWGTGIVLVLLAIGVFVTKDVQLGGTEGCLETDGGFNIFQKGTISGDYEPAGRDDFCSDENTLVEHTCGIGDKLIGPAANFKTEIVTCDNGCTDGACNSIIVTKCEDTDGGIDFMTQGQVSGQSSGLIPAVPRDFSVTTDRCEEDTLLEFYCSSDIEASVVSEECEAGCVDGACVEPSVVILSKDVPIIALGVLILIVIGYLAIRKRK